jgi:antitoxin component YwqK of YwqJK toxin-antitoxin module
MANRKRDSWTMGKIGVYGDDVLYHGDDGVYVDLDGHPFTGVVRELGPAGVVVAEDSMIDGLYEGLSRSWYRSGPLRREVHFLHDGLHGPYREWHANGQLKNEGEYEHGICTWMKSWDESGKLIADRYLSEGDHQYKSLEAYRRLYNMSKGPKG